MLFRQITVCLDMRGCPNRCRHCWLGVTPNGHLEEPDLRFVAQAFRPFTRDLEGTGLWGRLSENVGTDRGVVRPEDTAF